MKKRYCAILVLILVLDIVPDFIIPERFFVITKQPVISFCEDIKENTNHRANLMDLSATGSYASYGIAGDEDGVNYTFGWAWQGAATASNIVLLNTSLETGRYVYLFDRSIELGDDTVYVVKAQLEKYEGDYERLEKAANQLGFYLISEDESGYLFKKEVPEDYGVVATYEGLAIGNYANIMTLYYPKFTTASTVYIDELSVEELCKYKAIFLSGFEYHEKEAAEKVLYEAAKNGVRVVIDMTHIPADMITKRMNLLGVTSNDITLENHYPDLLVKDQVIVTDRFPEEDAQWKTGYLTGDMDVIGYTQYEGEKLDFAGVDKETGNIYYLGFNLMYYATQTDDRNVTAFMDDVIGIGANEVPSREFVGIKKEITDDKIVIEAEGDYENNEINTTIAYQDIFQTKQTISGDNNLLMISSGKTEIDIVYPYLVPGLILSILGVLAFVGTVLLSQGAFLPSSKM